MDRVISEGTLLASAARTASKTSDAQVNTTSRGVGLFLDVTANPGGAETLTVKIEWVDPVSGKVRAITAFSAIPAATNATYLYTLYPGALSSVTNQEVQQGALPKGWRVTVTHSSTGEWTYSLGYCLLV